MDITDYNNRVPPLKIEEYFEGKSSAWGVFQDRFGKVRRQFVVDIEGDWNERTQTLSLKEDFIYNDGETEQRNWVIKKNSDTDYVGTAAGVVGSAEGKSDGNSFNFKYTFDLPVEDKTWRVAFDDWMYLQDERVLFNKATVKKWGFRLGDVYIFFDRQTENLTRPDFGSNFAEQPSYDREAVE